MYLSRERNLVYFYTPGIMGATAVENGACSVCKAVGDATPAEVRKASYERATLESRWGSRSVSEGGSVSLGGRRSSPLARPMFSILAAMVAICSSGVYADDVGPVKDVIGDSSRTAPRSFPTDISSSSLLVAQPPSSFSHPSSPIHPIPPVSPLIPSSHSSPLIPSSAHSSPLLQGAPSSLLPPPASFQAPPPPPPPLPHLPHSSISTVVGVPPSLIVAPGPQNVVVPAEAVAPAVDYEGGSQPFPHDADPAPAGPLYFATENSTTVTAQIGSTALVPCVVRNIGDGMVSWIRRKDYHLLTVGLTTYSSDERYSAVHAQHSEDWTLQIKYVQERDAGLYECQVSSHPPTSIFIDLRVVEARADILGPSEKYLKSGSMLRLSCVLRQSTEPPVYVFWYHNNRMINYDRDRGVNVTSPVLSTSAGGSGQGAPGGVAGEGGEEGEDTGATAAVAGGNGGSEEPSEEEHASTLVIASAQKTHSGNYSCVPNNAQPASTYVHILNAGENPAAMQHGGRGLSWLRCPSAWLLAACLVASLSPSWQRRAAPLPTVSSSASSPRSQRGTTSSTHPPSRLRPGHLKPSEPWKKRRKVLKSNRAASSYSDSTCERVVRTRLKPGTEKILVTAT